MKKELLSDMQPHIDIEKFYKNWCRNTQRNGGVLIGKSIRELLTDFQKTILNEPSNGLPPDSDIRKTTGDKR